MTFNSVGSAGGAEFITGCEFNTAEPIRVTHLGHVDKQNNGIAAGAEVGVWSVSTGTLLDSVTVLPGSVSPAGSVPVSHGGSMTFQIRPNPAYCIVDVVVDGKSVGARSSYVFNDVTRDRKIWATFESEGPSKPEPPSIAERAKLRNRNSSKYLAVEGAHKTDGANVLIWDDMGQRDIWWYLEPRGKDRYKIRNLNSGKYLAVAGAAVNTANVIQWSDVGQQDILWELQGVESDCYKIRNVNSGKYLAVSYGAVTPGASVIQYQDEGQKGLVWCLE